MSYPTTPTPASIKITGVSPTLVSLTHSLKRQARSRGGQRWLMELDYPPLSRSEFAPLFAFANDQQGQYSTFTFTPPIYKDAQGTCSACTSAVEAVGATSITVTMTGTLKAGDFVKFDSHTKVYMVTGDLSGNGELLIQPPLVAATTAAAVVYSDVPFTMAFVNDGQTFARGISDMHEFSVALAEVV
jgi:hypothetical protein